MVLFNRIRKALELRRIRAEEEALEQEYAEELVKTNLDDLDLEELENLLLDLSNLDEEYFEDSPNKIQEVKDKIAERKREERISRLSEREQEIIDSIKEKKAKEEELIRKQESNRQTILERLNIYENFVFKKDTLSNKEIDALKSEGYTLENEFCVLEQKRINVLIKPPANHSVHHTFLVWSVLRLLEKNRKITRINEKLSVEADITFKFEDKMFAIEIETGNLLRKKEQLKEKVGDLNRKYSDRWIFLVSNKELLPKYNKFGLTATRANFAKKLEKLLKNS